MVHPESRSRPIECERFERLEQDDAVPPAATALARFLGPPVPCPMSDRSDRLPQ